MAAALAKAGLEVHAWYDCTDEEYERHIKAVLSAGLNIIIDDGGDLVHMMHTQYRDLIPQVIGGCEETTTGIIRLEALNREGKLEFPMVRVNNAQMKHFFDNRYGTGQSVWDGINRATNFIVAGKIVVVAGYGWCGKGVAMRAKGLGAKLGDFFVTVTGCEKVIDEEDFSVIKDGAILCNAGYFDCEIDMKRLREIAVEKKEVNRAINWWNSAIKQRNCCSCR